MKKASRKGAFAPALYVGFATLLCGCVSNLPRNNSYVGVTSESDKATLTNSIVDSLGSTFSPENTSIFLLPVSGRDSERVQAQLRDSLRLHGFGIAPNEAGSAGTHTVGYSMTPSGKNVRLGLSVDDASMACDYGRDGFGGLQLISQCITQPGELVTLKPPHADLLSKIAPQEPIKTEPLPTASGPLVLHPLAAETRRPDPEIMLAPTVSPPAVRPISPSSSVPVAPSVAPVAPAPVVAPARPVETWLLVGGQPIRSQMQAWAARGGWILIWPQRLDWIVPASASFSGDYVAALTSVITDIAENGRSIRVRFHDPNRTAVITNPAGDQLPQ